MEADAELSNPTSSQPQPNDFSKSKQQVLYKHPISNFHDIHLLPPSLMATIYSCKECSTNLNLFTNHLFPPDFYFESGNKNSLSFSWIDQDRYTFEKEDKIKPFFETLSYWGIHRNRTKIKCKNCGKLLGYVYDDGPPVIDTPGQFHFGPSQAIPRNPRFQFKSKALLLAPDS